MIHDPMTNNNWKVFELTLSIFHRGFGFWRQLCHKTPIQIGLNVLPKIVDCQIGRLGIDPLIAANVERNLCFLSAPSKNTEVISSALHNGIVESLRQKNTETSLQNTKYRCQSSLQIRAFICVMFCCVHICDKLG